MARIRRSHPPNEPILLRSGFRLTVTGEKGQLGSGETANLTGEARLRLLPRPGLELVSRSEAGGGRSSQTMEGVWTLAWERGNSAEFFWTNRKTTSSETGWMTDTVWSPVRQPIFVRGGCENPATEIRFAVVNFPSFNGRGDEVRTGENGNLLRLGCVAARAGSWLVELRECDNLREILGELRTTRGYALTHQGRIARSDGERVDAEEAGLLLRALGDFYSFARGACSALTLVHGLTSGGEVAWEHWGCRRVDPWRRECSSWFDLHHGHTLGEALPGFWRAYRGCPDERRALHQAIYWYLRSDTRQSGVDGGLILMQAALERLAHTFYRPKKPGEASALWLRAALLHRRIRVEIPGDAQALATYVNSVVKKNEIGDAVFAVTRLRNNAVHPRKDAQVPDRAYFQAWAVARWLLELMVLSVTGYQGQYANRLKRRFQGEVESVPWVAAEDEAQRSGVR